MSELEIKDNNVIVSDGDKEKISRILNKIRNRSIFSLVSSILIFLLYFGFFIFSILFLNKDISSNSPILSEVNSKIFPSVLLVYYIIIIILGIIVFIFNLINAIKILGTDFKNKQVNSMKIVWGILTIIVLGSIASLAFAFSARKKIFKNN